MTASEKLQQPKPLQLIADYIGPLNGLILIIGVALDILAPETQRGYGKQIGLCAGILLIALIWLIVHRLESCPKDMARFQKFKKVLTQRAVILSFIAFIALSLISTVSSAHAQSGGVIASKAPAVKEMQELLGITRDVSSIKEDVSEIRKAVSPDDARGKLLRMGYQLDVESKVRAISSCDLPALQLYIALGEPLPDAEPIWGVPAWFVLERPIRSGHPKLAEVIELLAAQGMSFKQGYALSYATTQPDLIPAQQTLIGKIPQDLRYQFNGPSLRVSPLTLALWFKNEAAVRTLVKYSDTDGGGVGIVVRKVERGVTGPEFILPLVSAKQEAERMGLLTWLEGR